MNVLRRIIARVAAVRTPPRSTVRVAFVVVVAAAAALLLSTASAQPQPGQPPPGAPGAAPIPGAPGAKPAAPGAKPAAKPGKQGLPSWHPAVGGKKPTDGKRADRRRQLEALRDATKRKAAQQRTQPTRAASKPKRPKYPVDEHGYCVGDGPNDVPRPINLVHGWLGAKDSYSAEDDFFSPQRPPRLAPKTVEMSWVEANIERQLPYWKWRLTPYPYRFDNHDDHCDPKNQPIPLLANIINIGVLFFLIRRFGRKPLIEGLKNRKKSIMGEIDRARAIRKSAAKRLDKYQDELDNLDSKLASLRQQYQAEGDTEEKRMVSDMGETRDRMIDDADFRISQESKAARDTLSRQALQDALSAAEALLHDRITEADHDRLAEEYLEQIATALKDEVQA